MRTAADVLTDPKPGDVVRKGSAERHVLYREHHEIHYMRGPGRRTQKCWITTWRDWARKGEAVNVVQS